MMPARNTSVITCSECGEYLDGNEALPTKPNEKQIMQLMSTFTKHKELKDALCDKSLRIQENIETYSILTPCCVSDACANLVRCKNVSSSLSSDFTSFYEKCSIQGIAYSPSVQLKSYSKKMLNAHIVNLSRLIEEVSSKLVTLLQENDALQQESDARLVVIEQLLKMTVKNPENEVGPIMMSVISLPDHKNDENSIEEIV